MAAGRTARSRALAEAKSLNLEQIRGRPVTIECRDGSTDVVHVGRLYVDQLVALSRESTKLLQRAVSAPAAVQAISAGGFTAFTVLGALLSELEPPQVARFFAILIDRDERWVRANVDVAAMADIIEAVSEHNDLQHVLLAFRRAARHWRPTESAAPSNDTEPSSPPPPSTSDVSEDGASHG